jgi:hypothetical protein
VLLTRTWPTRNIQPSLSRDLSGANSIRADLSGAILTKAYLNWADLHERTKILKSLTTTSGRRARSTLYLGYRLEDSGAGFMTIITPKQYFPPASGSTAKREV